MMAGMTPTRSYRKAAKGQGIFELVTGMIFFILMSLAFSGLSVYIYVTHSGITAVREGARIGSLNNEIGGVDVAAGTTAVSQRVIDFMAVSTGQVIPPGAVTVTPPNPADPIGARTVTVTLNYNMPTPLNPAAAFSGFSGGGSSPVTVPVFATATMRYEE